MGTFCRLYKGLVPLWGRQIPCKFEALQRLVLLLDALLHSCAFLLQFLAVMRSFYLYGNGKALTLYGNGFGFDYRAKNHCHEDFFFFR